MKVLKGIIFFFLALLFWGLCIGTFVLAFRTGQNLLIRVASSAFGIFLFFSGIWAIERASRVWGVIEGLCDKLQAIGVNARLAERGCPEEACHSRFWGKGWVSQGLIDIERSPIRWVNVLYKMGHSDSDPGMYMCVCGIPDTRPLPELDIHAKYAKSFPLFGHVTDVGWEGNDHGTGLTKSLTTDQALKAAIIASHSLFWGEPSVETCPEQKCWLILIPFGPTLRQWDCCEKIAERLLVTPLSAV